MTRGREEGTPIRILLVSANFRPSVGGVERFVEILADGLAGRGHEVTVLCCREEGAPPVEEAGGVRIVRVRSNLLLKRRLGVPYPLPSPRALVRELRRLVSWADIVHVHDSIYATSLAALAVSRARKRPAVLTQHVGFIPQRTKLLDAVQRTAIITLGRCSRLASRVVAYNPAVADWARSTWGLEEVAVLPAGVPAPEAPSTGRDAVRASFDLPPDRFLVLFVGRDVWTKRLDVVLAATDPSYEIVAVTDRARDDGAPVGVRLLPFMPSERLMELLFAVDAFVLPSEMEGFPLSLQEALLAGLPCVVSRVPGYESHLAEDEVLWVESTPESVRDALRRLVTDERLRAQLAGRAAAAGRREFGLDGFVDAYERLYADTLARPARAAGIGRAA